MGKAIGFGVNAPGGGATGNIGGATTPPGNVGTITVTGFIDPATLTITLTVKAVAPTDPGDTITAGHLYLEVPDQSAGTTFTLGSSTLAGTDTLSGPWAPIDCGIQPIAALVAGVTLTVPGPPGLDASVDIASRLYINSVSANGENKLVRANATGPTPSQTFKLVSLASGTPTSGTNITTLTTTTGPVTIVATALSPVNVSGKLDTPVVVIVGNVPVGLVPISNGGTGRPGSAPRMGKWAYRLVLTYDGTDATVPANQFVAAAGPFTQAGIVGQSTYELASADGVSVPHSFLLNTPKAVTKAIVWLQAGYVDGGGLFVGNNIVPGITPGFPITFGSTTGTTDAAAIMASTIAASMAVVAGLFGVATAGITNPLLGAGAVATLNIAGIAVTDAKLAALAVTSTAGDLSGNQALAGLAVATAAIQTAAITNALMANAAVGHLQVITGDLLGANIASATIAGANIALATIAQANMAIASIGTAQIQSLAVTNAKINDLAVDKLTAGNLTVTMTITSGALLINSGALTVNIDGTNYLKVSSSTTFTQLQGTAIVAGSSVNALDYCEMTPTTLILNTHNSGGYIAFEASPSVFAFSCSTGTSVGGGGGASALPANPTGYATVNINGVSRQIAYY